MLNRFSSEGIKFDGRAIHSSRDFTNPSVTQRCCSMTTLANTVLVVQGHERVAPNKTVVTLR